MEFLAVAFGLAQPVVGICAVNHLMDLFLLLCFSSRKNK